MANTIALSANKQNIEYSINGGAPQSLSLSNHGVNMTTDGNGDIVAELASSSSSGGDSFAVSQVKDITYDSTSKHIEIIGIDDTILSRYNVRSSTLNVRRNGDNIIAKIVE